MAAHNNENNNQNFSQRQTPPRRGPGGGFGGLHGVGGGEKAKNFKQAMSKLLVYLRPEFPKVILALIFAIGATLISIFAPNILGSMNEIILVGIGVSSINLAEITRIGLMLAALYLISSVSTYIQSFVMSGITQRTTKKLRKNISTTINELPLKYFDNVPYGDVLSRVTNDVDTIAQSLNQSIVQLLSAVLLISGLLVIMFVTSWQLAIVVLVVVPLSLLVVGIVIKNSQKYYRRQQRLIGELNGHIEENYSGHNTIKMFCAETKAIEEFEETNKKLYAPAWKSQFLSGLMQPLMQFIGNLGYVAVCVVGGLLMINNQIGFEVLTAFMIYVRLFNQPLGQIAQATNSLQSTAAAAERVFEFLEEEKMPEEGRKTQEFGAIKKEICFNNVNFGYKEGQTVIKDFSACVKAGQKVAIVGPTGAGKTTLVNLLMRFYEVGSGSITIDGVDVREAKRENIRGNFGMVLQDTWLLDGTLRENIKYNTIATDEKVKEAIRLTGLEHFVSTLPQGIDTVLDENTAISQGQRQLVTIARAMVEDAPMLILDEATSSVDTRTELIIQSAMDTLMKGRTSFIIAHRLSTIKNADVIFVMKDGNIVEKGSHEVLLAEKGFYAELYNSQFDN